MARRTIPSLVVGFKTPGSSLHHQIDWAETPSSLPPLLGYRSILVVPAENTEDQQEKLITILQGQLGTLGPRTVRVIWILNSFTHPRVSEFLSLGKLVPLPDVASGSLITWMRGVESESWKPVFGLSKLPWAATPFAIWQRSDKRLEIPVGISGFKNPWVLAPPCAQPDTYLEVKWESGDSLLRGSLPLLAILLLLLMASVRHYGSLTRLYENGVATVQINVTDNLPITYPDQEIETHWLSPQRRLARRLLSQPLEHWRGVEQYLNQPSLPLEKIFTKIDGDGEVEILALYDIAILSGDLPGALRVLKHTAGSSSSPADLMRVITATTWQAALESLHENDFTQAREWTDLYLAMSQSALSERQELPTQDPQRNRTLAHILQRELVSGRAKALCRSTGVRDSFGRLLGGQWGFPLPSQIEGLSQRRQANAATNCANLEGTPIVDYSILQQLAAMREDESGSPLDPASQPEVCGIAPVECAYLSLQPLFGKTLSQGEVEDIVAFASNCSYLSDDAIDILLRKEREEEDSARIPFGSLATALQCVNPARGDYFGLIDDTLRKAPCDWFDFGKSNSSRIAASVGELARSLVARCRGGVK